MPAKAIPKSSCPCCLLDTLRKLFWAQPDRAVGIRRVVANGLERFHCEAGNESDRVFHSGSGLERLINRSPAQSDWTSIASHFTAPASDNRNIAAPSSWSWQFSLSTAPSGSTALRVAALASTRSAGRCSFLHQQFHSGRFCLPLQFSGLAGCLLERILDIKACITPFPHASTVTVEETGGQSGVGATAISTAFVLTKIRCSRADALIGPGAPSGVFLSTNVDLGSILQKITVSNASF